MTATAAANELIPGWREAELPLHDKLDRDMLVRAYRFSEIAHRGQVRNSGDPYITHSVEVAKILAELGLDSVTVAAGLLHDVVEDTDIGLRDVEDEFGKQIADIDERAEATRTRLIARYSAMETALSLAETMMRQVQAQMDAMTARN